MPEGLVGQPAKDSISIVAVATVPATPVINGVRAEFENSFVRSAELSDAGQVEVVKSAECREVREEGSSLSHVKALCAVCMTTSINGKLRPLSWTTTHTI